MKTRLFFGVQVLTLAFLFSLSALAGPVFNVTIDTSSVAGSDGAIYLQFNPGSGVASVTINPFSVGSGTLLSGAGSGDFSGSLDPPPLTLTNTISVNDYLQFLTYGDLVSFSVSFNLGPLSSAIFSFAATAADGLTPVLILDPDWDYFLGDISFDEAGAFSVNNYNPDLVSISNPIPEPSTFSLLAVGLGLAGLRLRKRT